MHINSKTQGHDLQYRTQNTEWNDPKNLVMHTRIQLQEVGTNFIMKESMFTQLSTIIIIQQHAKWKSALLAVAADTPAQQQCCHTLQISHCTQFVALGWEQVPAEQLFSREKTAEASSKVKSYREAVHELILSMREGKGRQQGDSNCHY